MLRHAIGQSTHLDPVPSAGKAFSCFVLLYVMEYGVWWKMDVRRAVM